MKEIIQKIAGKVCVSISGATIAESLLTAVSVAKEADVVEIRLDGLDQIEIQPFIDALSKPLLFTNRASWEGGAFNGSEKERVGALQEAIDLKAAFVDIELKTGDMLRSSLLDQAKQQNTTSIVSWHNFSGTPSTRALVSILQEQYRTGADIGKIVTMATNYQDVLRVLNLQVTAAEIGFPLIAFCMGKEGVISRVATLALGGYMTYAAANEAFETAPGQMAVVKLQRVLKEIHAEN